ncbi:hypothetical protein Pan14r_29220 [Crateriforma conspicua]|uniref:Uncharacterized protein n=1 Tax=Crateriforma conspicua TaxID=2527996 RepID=A0A5C5Y8M2_9PLAN|nr:hypothetical protein Mal65_43890 [Crateriforma conspicua]TWT70615.1 hypothetical protein Pan14r_29220 [Crateriforma conspicua]
MRWLTQIVAVATFGNDLPTRRKSRHENKHRSGLRRWNQQRLTPESVSPSPRFINPSALSGDETQTVVISSGDPKLPSVRHGFEGIGEHK